MSHNRTSSLSRFKADRGRDREKSEKPPKDKSLSKSPSSSIVSKFNFWGKESSSPHGGSTDTSLLAASSSSVDGPQMSTSPSYPSLTRRLNSTTSKSSAISSNTSGPLHSPKHHSLSRHSTSSQSLEQAEELHAPSLEPIKKGHIRVLLPNKQVTMIKINKRDASLEEALMKAMNMRDLSAEKCFVYRLKPMKRVLPWKTPVTDVDREEIRVEDKMTTTFQNPHIWQSKGQMSVKVCSVCTKYMNGGAECSSCGYRSHKHCLKKANPYCDPFPNSAAEVNNTDELIKQLPEDDSILDIFNHPALGMMDEPVKITRTNIKDMADAYNTPTTPSRPTIPRVISMPSLHHEPSGGIHSDTQSSKTLTEASDDGSFIYDDRRPRTVTAPPLSDPTPRSLLRKEPTLVDDSGREPWEISIDQVKILEKVGAGAYGTVYKGEHHGVVAVKMLNCTTPTPEMRDVFDNEVKVLLNTRHTRVLLFIAVIMKPLGIVTQWCEGSSLYHLLHVVEFKLSPEQDMTIADQIAQGMDYLHSRRIVHRDLKSPNVLLEHKANLSDMDMMGMESKLSLINVKIADFGLSAMNLAANKCPVNQQQVMGSLLWMAPEIINGKVSEPYTERSDIYAFGVICYELITKSLPFPDIRNRDQLLWMIGSGSLRINLESTGKKYPEVSKEFRLLFKRCVNFIVDERPSFKQADIELRNILECLPKLRKGTSLPDFSKTSLAWL